MQGARDSVGARLQHGLVSGIPIETYAAGFLAYRWIAGFDLWETPSGVAPLLVGYVLAAARYGGVTSLRSG